MLKFGSKSDINFSYKCTVRLLDDIDVLECEFQPHHKGLFLLEHVCKELNVIDRDYFGLRYVDSTQQRHWLDLDKAILKQIKDLDPIVFSFRVKFYPPNPLILQEEMTRYQVYLQLKRDLLHGRLYCNQSDAVSLGAYIVQAELGDYDPEVCLGNYISDMKLLLKQTLSLEEKILELHQTQLRGQSFMAMETEFLKKACQLDTYGVDPHSVKDHKGNNLYLGVNHHGVLTFHGSKKSKHFNWSEIQKINYEGKMFIIHLVYYEKKHTVGFKCTTAAACRYLWRCAVEQMVFFTLQKSSDAPIMTGGGLFSWGTKFKYSGRTEKEILQESRSSRMRESELHGSGFFERKTSSDPVTPSTPIGSELNVPGLDGLNDNCFQDSFDQSSFDSQHQDSFAKVSLTPFKSSRSLSSQQLLSIKREGSNTMFCPPSSQSISQTTFPAELKDNQSDFSTSKFKIFQVFVPSFFFVAISFITATVLILESDSDILSNIRELPEMVTLNNLYYQPLKEFFLKMFLNFRY